jgi:hypothetical protein
MPKTTTVLPANPAEARRLLLEKLKTDTVLFVVLGEGAGPTALANEAIRFAGDDDDPRAVICAPHTADIVDAIKGLNSSPPTLTDTIVAGNAAAFTTSAEGEIRDVIALDETVDNVRVLQAYTRAEES